MTSSHDSLIRGKGDAMGRHATVASPVILREASRMNRGEKVVFAGIDSHRWPLE